jgi:hypothetical protein
LAGIAPQSTTTNGASRRALSRWLGREVLAGAALALQQHRARARRRGLEHDERAAHRRRAADQPAEPLALRQRELDLPRSDVEPQLGAAERQHRAVAQRRLDHRHAVDQRAVAAAQVLDHRRTVPDPDLAVELRHRAVGDHQVGLGVGADHHALGREQERRPVAAILDTRQPTLAHARAQRLGGGERLGGARIVGHGDQSSVSPAAGRRFAAGTGVAGTRRTSIAPARSAWIRCG